MKSRSAMACRSLFSRVLLRQIAPPSSAAKVAVPARAFSTGLENGCAWMDGSIVPMSEARMPVNDWGVTHSDICYDVVPVWDGGFFRLPVYLDRFEASMAALRMDVGMDRPAMEAALGQMVGASRLRNAYVSMNASRGTPPPGSRDPRQCRNHFFAWCVPYVHVIKPELAKEGATAWIAKSVRRIPSASIDPRVKNYHWGDFTYGLLEAKDNGAETAILLDTDDNVTEGPGFNIFSVKNGRVVTPDAGVLEGISRRTVLEICAELGYAVEIRPLGVSEFIQSDEVFISTSAGGVAPLRMVDGQAIGNGAPGDVYQQIHKLYWEWMARPENRTEVSY